MAELKEIIVLIIISIIILSCKENNNVNQREFEIAKKIDSLNNFLQVSNISITDSSNFEDYYVQALIDHRNADFQSAFRNFDFAKEKKHLVSPVHSKYREFIIHFYYNKFKLGDFSFKDVEELLLEINSAKQDKDVLNEVKLLQVLSSILRDLSETKFSLACSSLAIKKATKEKLDSSVIALTCMAHAINLTREENIKNDTFFFKKASEFCGNLNSPICKYNEILKYYSMGIYSLDQIPNDRLHEILDTSYYFPWYNQAIRIHLKWMLEDSLERQKIIVPQIIQSNRNKLFSNLYDIDDLINAKKFEDAIRLLKRFGDPF